MMVLITALISVSGKPDLHLMGSGGLRNPALYDWGADEEAVASGKM